ncbi:uncharacterized protein [Oscarella lobularis]|uniref:uncharacterized protein n=1 Tax=Oscarella lobularis TaxID=121494 RepID=UPI0033134713
MTGAVGIIVAYVLFMVRLVSATGPFTGYSLHCDEAICQRITPCANLGNELRFFNFTLGSLQTFGGYSLIITLHPMTNLTDVTLLVECSAIIVPGVHIHCAFKDYLCYDKSTSWENMRCPIPAFESTSYVAAFDRNDSVESLERVAS